MEVAFTIFKWFGILNEYSFYFMLAVSTMSNNLRSIIQLCILESITYVLLVFNAGCCEFQPAIILVCDLPK